MKERPCDPGTQAAATQRLPLTLPSMFIAREAAGRASPPPSCSCARTDIRTTAANSTRAALGTNKAHGRSQGAIEGLELVGAVDT